ncbi:MFS transporter [Streptomyces sp. NPDC003077]|uniref:MFS transporter n=1 Tax=Streptomyces sp. NPDC003077 TaxID=3154443 RepID=UPI0033A83CD6
MPAPLLALVLSVFSLGTAESVIAGLLPRLSADLDVSLSQAGLLVSGYALAIVVGGPLVTLATSRLPRKPLLVALMSLFVAGNVLAALAPGYGVLMTARVLSALSHCTLFALSLITAAEIAGPRKSGSAVARIIIGVNLATIVGVPLGLLLAQQWGWRATFWGVTALSAISLVACVLLVPGVRTSGEEGAAAELKVLRDRRVQVALVLTVVGMAGGFAAFTFLTPLLEQVSGFSGPQVTILLFLFGLGSLAGGLLGGRLADRALMGSLTVLLGVLAVALAAFAGVAPQPVAAVGALVVFSVVFFALNPGLGARVLNSVSGRAPTLAVSMSIASVQTAIALGAWLGGQVLDLGYGLRSVFLVAAAVTVAGCSLAWLEWRADHRATPQPGNPAATAPATDDPRTPLTSAVPEASAAASAPALTPDRLG